MTTVWFVAYDVAVVVGHIGRSRDIRE